MPDVTCGLHDFCEPHITPFLLSVVSLSIYMIQTKLRGFSERFGFVLLCLSPLKSLHKERYSFFFWMPGVMAGTVAATCEHEESQTKVKADTLRRADRRSLGPQWCP